MSMTLTKRISYGDILYEVFRLHEANTTTSFCQPLAILLNALFHSSRVGEECMTYNCTRLEVARNLMFYTNL